MTLRPCLFQLMADFEDLDFEKSKSQMTPRI
jgi:hypothetical protein